MAEISTELQNKTAHLNEILDSLQSAAVAFSGGTDSSLLAAAAFQRLKDKAIAVTAYSETLATEEQEDAARIASFIGIRHVLLSANEMNDENFTKNAPDRCFHCKKIRFGVLSEWASRHKIPWIIEGSNVDDLNDFRPGMRATASMPIVRSPLLEAGLTKSEIRILSKEWGLQTWDKPSAACLASRIAFGQPINPTNLLQVEQAERIIRRFASGQIRVRHHGSVARIEVEPSEMTGLIDPTIAEIISKELKSIGFPFVTMDLTGYRMGSLNETL